MRYWDLLKSSKSTIKLKKDQIDTLLSCCRVWSTIITKQRNLKQGQTVDEDEIEFVEEVCDEFKEWFKDEPKLESMKDEWRRLHGELRNDQMWWQKKKTKIVNYLKQQSEELDEAARQKLEECATWIGTLCAGVAVLCTAAAAAAFVVGGGAAIVGAVVVIAGAISGTAYAANSAYNEANKEAKLLRMKSADSIKLATKMKNIAKGFKEMTQDSGKMDKLFGDFMDDMRKPKKVSGKVQKMHDKKKYNLKKLQFHVASIIKSFELLQKHSIDILETIDHAQNRFNQ